MMFPYNRLNEIFDYVRQDNIVSASQLSVLLNITDRTIRSDIQAINEILEKNGAKIKLKRNWKEGRAKSGKQDIILRSMIKKNIILFYVQ